MKTAVRLTWGSAKIWLGAAVIAAVLLMVGGDRTPTYATNPEIGPSLSATSPTWPSGAILLVKGGHFSGVGNSPCVPGDSDPTTICVRVWAKGVNNATGASAFQVHFTYPDNMLSVSGVASSSTWLGSTGRSAACPAPSFAPGDSTFSCSTISAPPPYGATGNGILGTIAIESRDVIGPAVINLSDGTFLIDTPLNPDDQTIIPATVRSLNVYVAPCADLAPPADGHVTTVDILYVVHKYHTNDAGADLNGDGIVLTSDILIAAGEFGTYCTR